MKINLLSIFIIIFITLLFILKLYLFNKYYKADNISIILTTAVNNNEDRLNTYLDRINKYIDKTNINFYIVESTGYTFPQINNPRVKIYSFIGTKASNSTFMEVESITNIMDFYNLHDSDFILKITGKYFVPNIEYLTNKYINNYYDFFIQKKHYHSEIFACKPKYYERIKELSFNTQFETIIDIITTKEGKTKDFPVIKLNDFTPRGDNIVLEKL